MAERIKLPVGVDLFKKMREDGFFYIDKTRLIEQLLENGGEVRWPLYFIQRRSL